MLLRGRGKLLFSSVQRDSAAAHQFAEGCLHDGKALARPVTQDMHNPSPTEGLAFGPCVGLHMFAYAVFINPLFHDRKRGVEPSGHKASHEPCTQTILSS